MSHIDASISKEIWRQHGFAEQEIPKERLYNVILDPNENHNLADDPTVSDILKQMRNRLERWMERTNDPLRHGAIPAPRAHPAIKGG